MGLTTIGLLASFILIPGTIMQAQEYKKVTEVEGISEYKLDNGVQVLLFPDDSKPQFTVNMTVLVGSRHEGYGETGMAHLLEHMLFKGTEVHPDIPKLLKDRSHLAHRSGGNSKGLSGSVRTFHVRRRWITSETTRY